MRNALRNVSTLTNLACDRLKHGSLGDPTHPGLRIMARPSGAKVWIYRFRDPAGKMAQLLVGSFPALSLADARAEWRNHRQSGTNMATLAMRCVAGARLRPQRRRAARATRYRAQQKATGRSTCPSWRGATSNGAFWSARSCLKSASVLLADLKPSQVMASGRAFAQKSAAGSGHGHFRTTRSDQTRTQHESAGFGCSGSDERDTHHPARKTQQGAQ